MVRYSILDMLRNAISLIYTKLLFPKARLIRLPIFLSGKKFKYGKGLTMGRGCRIETNKCAISLSIGENARIGDYVHINADCLVKIGDNVLMASKIFISDTNHGSYSGENQSNPESHPAFREYVYKPVLIGNNVWIGENVVILPGTIVGNGCVIGANAVLTGREFPDNSIIAGIPAKVIKTYSNDEKIWKSVK